MATGGRDAPPSCVVCDVRWGAVAGSTAHPGCVWRNINSVNSKSDRLRYGKRPRTGTPAPSPQKEGRGQVRALALARLAGETDREMSCRRCSRCSCGSGLSRRAGGSPGSSDRYRGKVMLTNLVRNINSAHGSV